MTLPVRRATLPGLARPPAASIGSPWRLWRWGMALLCAMCVLILWRMPDVDGVQTAVRATARTSMACFLVAFTASALFRLWPGAFTQGLLRHRRQWGLLFAGSHALHAAGIVGLAWLAEPSLFAQLTPLPSRVLGGLGYGCLLVMALTSSDAAVRWLGHLRWQRLHRWGGHLIWLVFLMSCLKRIPLHAIYALPAVLLLAAMTLRWVASRNKS